jgi:hypothetical protein
MRCLVQLVCGMMHFFDQIHLGVHSKTEIDLYHLVISDSSGSRYFDQTKTSMPITWVMMIGWLERKHKDIDVRAC